MQGFNIPGAGQMLGLDALMQGLNTTLSSKLGLAFPFTAIDYLENITTGLVPPGTNGGQFINAAIKSLFQVWKIETVLRS